MPTPSRPSNIQIPFAATGAKNAIPVAPASPLASFTDGFPPVNMQPIVAGGVPPQGKDFNGILYDITTHTLWVNAGGQYLFDAALSTAMGGYPVGMVLQNNALSGSYVCASANNTTDFNSTPGSIGTLWMPWAGDALRTQGTIWCGTSGGSANVQTFTPSPPLGALVAGATLSGIAGFTNSGALTVNVSGLGAKAVKKDGPGGPVPLVGGEWVAGNIITLKYDGVAFQLTATELGDISTLNIGQGLENDGAGNVRVKLADASIRRTAAGIQANGPITQFSGSVSVLAANHDGMFVSTGTGTLTVPHTTTAWNGFGFGVTAKVGNVTLTPDAADSIAGGAAGASYVVPNGTSALFIGDGAGNINVFYQTAIPGASPAPQYVNSSQSVSSGQYNVDTTAAPITLTLPASPPNGTPIVMFDPFLTWGLNSVTLTPGGGDTVQGLSSFVLDVSVDRAGIVYKSGNWGF